MFNDNIETYPSRQMEDAAIPDTYNDTPLDSLRVSTRKKLDQLLTISGENTDNGRDDHRKLARLLCLDDVTDGPSHTLSQLLDHWSKKQCALPATIGGLKIVLANIGRQDVLESCRANIVKDCQVYTGPTPALIRRVISYPEGQPFPDMPGDDESFTVDDVRTGQKTKYDAFVSYVPYCQEDTTFVLKMIAELEKRGLKLFVPGRDDLPGTASHSTNAYLIEQRCTRVILVMSKAFLRCSACDFQLRFTQSLCPGQRSRKIVPVILENLSNDEFPRILKDLTKCDFSQEHIPITWKWEKLESALLAPAGEYKLFEPEEGTDTCWDWIDDPHQHVPEYPRLPEIHTEECCASEKTQPVSYIKTNNKGLISKVKLFISKKTSAHRSKTQQQ